MAVMTKIWIYKKKFCGMPSADNFQLVEEDIDTDLDDGEVLTKAEYLSVDPYMRMEEYTDEVLGSTMIGEQIARVIDSKSFEFPVGSHVVGFLGWRTVTKAKSKELRRLSTDENLPRTVALGCLGWTGLTAYFGTLDILKPKEGEVVVVSGAAGAVGSVVGQIAKIKGCSVIGFAGSQAKVDWITEDLGFDYGFNYKTTSVDEALDTAAPDGVDCYFDNVGGDITLSVLGHIRMHGRVACCGGISSYNNVNTIPTRPFPFSRISVMGVRLEGFDVTSRFGHKAPEGLKQLSEWVQQGKIKYKEHITEGFQRMPKAFMELFDGKNFGKAIVKV